MSLPSRPSRSNLSSQRRSNSSALSSFSSTLGNLAHIATLQAPPKVAKPVYKSLKSSLVAAESPPVRTSPYNSVHYVITAPTRATAGSGVTRTGAHPRSLYSPPPSQHHSAFTRHETSTAAPLPTSARTAIRTVPPPQSTSPMYGRARANSTPRSHPVSSSFPVGVGVPVSSVYPPRPHAAHAAHLSAQHLYPHQPVQYTPYPVTSAVMRPHVSTATTDPPSLSPPSISSSSPTPTQMNNNMQTDTTRKTTPQTSVGKKEGRRRKKGNEKAFSVRGKGPRAANRDRSSLPPALSSPSSSPSSPNSTSSSTSTCSSSSPFVSSDGLNSTASTASISPASSSTIGATSHAHVVARQDAVCKTVTPPNHERTISVTSNVNDGDNSKASVETVKSTANNEKDGKIPVVISTNTSTAIAAVTGTGSATPIDSTLTAPIAPHNQTITNSRTVIAAAPTVLATSTLQPMTFQNNSNSNIVDDLIGVSDIGNGSGGEPLSSEEKIKRRLARKAELARASRRRKKAYVQDLEHRVNSLTARVAELLAENARLKASASASASAPASAPVAVSANSASTISPTASTPLSSGASSLPLTASAPAPAHSTPVSSKVAVVDAATVAVAPLQAEKAKIETHKLSTHTHPAMKTAMPVMPTSCPPAHSPVTVMHVQSSCQQPQAMEVAKTTKVQAFVATNAANNGNNINNSVSTDAESVCVKVNSPLCEKPVPNVSTETESPVSLLLGLTSAASASTPASTSNNNGTSTGTTSGTKRMFNRVRSESWSAGAVHQRYGHLSAAPLSCTHSHTHPLVRTAMHPRSIPPASLQDAVSPPPTKRAKIQAHPAHAQAHTPAVVPFDAKSQQSLPVPIPARTLCMSPTPLETDSKGTRELVLARPVVVARAGL